MSKVRALRTLSGFLIVFASVAAGCGGEEQAQTTATPETTSTSPRVETARVAAYFMRGDRIGVAARRTGDIIDPGFILLEVLRGPTAKEAAAGLTTEIPAGTRLLGVDVAGGVATVDLSGEFDDGGGSASMLGRLAQVVYTVTQMSIASRVRFRIEGEPVEVFSSEGIVLDRPQSRSDFEDQAPAILVEYPAVGDAISSPSQLRGTANTFEATFEYELRDSAGDKLVGTFVTATCGTGCRGTFDETLTFTPGGQTTGTLVVFERSAEDGSKIHEVEIPVRFGNPLG
jgi:immunoglobulin-like protein involved in spore germination/sporulation and spore germination protein